MSTSETRTTPVCTYFFRNKVCPYPDHVDRSSYPGENTSPSAVSPDLICDREIAKSDPVNFSSTASGSDEVCQVLPTPGAGRECLFFLQGRCAKGDACTYSHTPESGTGMRRGPCKFFGEGKCVKGDSCPFSHTVTKFTIPFDDALREPCKFFSLGKCLKGDLCMFRHSTTEVVTPISSNKPITRDPCKFFSEGKCIKGDACAWDHVLGPNSSFVASGVLHIPYEVKDCNYFPRGKCKNGNACASRHVLAAAADLPQTWSSVQTTVGDSTSGQSHQLQGDDIDSVNGHVPAIQIRPEVSSDSGYCQLCSEGIRSNGHGCVCRHDSLSFGTLAEPSPADRPPWGKNGCDDNCSRQSPPANHSCGLFDQGYCKEGPSCPPNHQVGGESPEPRHRDAVVSEAVTTASFEAGFTESVGNVNSDQGNNGWPGDEDHGGQRTPTIPGGACKYFDSGHCKKGSSCPYIHSGTDHHVSKSHVDCRFFNQGTCWRGETCKFRHNTVNQSFTEWAADPSADDNSDQRKDGWDVDEDHGEQRAPTTPAAGTCKYFESGHCKKGDRCTYIHIGTDNQTSESRSDCRFFSQGTCRRGEVCDFRHSVVDPSFTQWGADPSADDGSAWGKDSWGMDSWDVDEDRSKQRTPTARAAGACKYFESGHCKKGDRCTYIHIGTDNQTSESRSDCRFFSQETCRRGEACDFRHSVVDPSFTQWGADPSVDDGSAWGKDSWGMDSWDVDEDRSKQRTPTARAAGACKYFESGHCKKGNNCQFIHTGLDNQTSERDSDCLQGTCKQDEFQHRTVDPSFTQWGADPSVDDDSAWGKDSWGMDSWDVDEDRSKQITPTAQAAGTCKYFDSGHCKKGDRCSYTHASTDRQPSELHSDCPSFDQETCRQGEFQHRTADPSFTQWGADLSADDDSAWGKDSWGMDGSNVDEDRSKQRTPTARAAGTCKYFDSGHCKKGDRCPSTHTSTDRRPSESRADCRYFNQGTCRRGNACGYRHGVPNPSFTEWAADLSPDNGSARGKGSWSGDDNHNGQEIESADRADCNQDVSPPSAHDHIDEWSSPSLPLNEFVADKESLWEKHSWPESEDASGLRKSTTALNFRPCIHIERGQNCRKDDECRFLHQPTGIATQATHNGVSDDLATRRNIRRYTEPTEEFTVERPILNCTVRLGKAATIHQATTAFESCQIVLSNLPADVTEANIIDLTTPFGNATVVLIDMTPTNLLIAHVDYAQCIQASRAVNYLNNMDYRSLKLAARLNIRTVESATGSVLSRKVKIRWNAPSLIAWAHYKTITVAKKQAEVLNGKAFSNGRKITASFLRPRKSQTHSFTVELGLPLGTESADIVAFCTEATGVTLGGPTYDLQSCTENVYNLLQGFGSVDSFDVVPDNNTKVKVLAFARFSSVETAAMAARAHGSNPEFLKGNTLSIEHVHWMKYAIPSLQFKAVKADLDRLRQSHDKEPKLHYHDQDAHGLPIDPVRVHIYAANPKAVARLRMALEIPLKGKLLVSNGKCVWDEYFNTREGAYFIRKLNADSEFLVQCDTRTRTLRLCGPVAYLERAHHMITSQLGDVYTRRHVINLRNGLVRPLITGGLNMLQNGPGSGKLTLDVTAPSLTIRGDSGDYERVRRALAAMDSASPVEKTQNASVPCPVCLCEATDIDAIALSCGHVYCMLCLQCLLRSAAGPDFFLPRCVAESRLDGSEKTTRCNTDISLDVICDVLSPEEEKALLESSFSSHIHRRPEEFQYCPTLNCQAVYRTDDSGTVLRCPSCLTWICPACHVDFHEGLTCTEYQDISREVHRKM